MPRPRKPWFRVYVEAMSDRKIRRLTPAHRWLFIALLGAARQSPTSDEVGSNSAPSRGHLLVSFRDPMDANDIADFAGMTLKEVNAGLKALERAGMIELDYTHCDLPVWRVVNWSDRQYESDNSTQRTRKHRSNEQRRNVPTSSQGTPEPSSREHPQKTETDTDTKTHTREPESAPPDEPADEGPDDGFAAFWSKYPRRNGTRVGKKQAHAAWKRLPKSKRPDVMAALDVYAANCGEYPKDAFRWLRPGVWDEWIPDTQPLALAASNGVRIINGVPHRHVSGSGFVAIKQSSGDYLE